MPDRTQTSGAVRDEEEPEKRRQGARDGRRPRPRRPGDGTDDDDGRISKAKQAQPRTVVRPRPAVEQDADQDSLQQQYGTSSSFQGQIGYLGADQSSRAGDGIAVPYRPRNLTDTRSSYAGPAQIRTKSKTQGSFGYHSAASDDSSRRNLYPQSNSIERGVERPRGQDRDPESAGRVSRDLSSRDSATRYDPSTRDGSRQIRTDLAPRQSTREGDPRRTAGDLVREAEYSRSTGNVDEHTRTNPAPRQAAREGNSRRATDGPGGGRHQQAHPETDGHSNANRPPQRGASASHSSMQSAQPSSAAGSGTVAQVMRDLRICQKYAEKYDLIVRVPITEAVVQRLAGDRQLRDQIFSRIREDFRAQMRAKSGSEGEGEMDEDEEEEDDGNEEEVEEEAEEDEEEDDEDDED